MATVKDIVWKEGQDPTKDMPTAIMVEVDDYDGPKFPGVVGRNPYHGKELPESIQPDYKSSLFVV
jgi:hypothetical protein